MAFTKPKDDVIYASVLADGRIHVRVAEGTEGSVKRSYKTSDGNEGSTIEMVYADLVGKITKVGFFEGDYGLSIQLTVEDGKEGSKPTILSLSTRSNYGEDVMKKIFNVNMEKVVKISPYSFTDDKGKKKKGITIWQKNEGEKAHKIPNYFYDEEAKAPIHGYPQPKKLKGDKPLSKDQWKMYFDQVREFLVEKVTEHFKIEEKAVVPEMSDSDFENF